MHEDNIDNKGTEPSVAAIVRTEEWIDAYERQATDSLFEKATRYATLRAKQVEAVGGRGDDDYVEDLVQAAFADTYTGQLAWDPSRASLEQQVIQTVKNRTRHDRERAVARPHISFEIHDQRRKTASMRGEVEASLAADREPDYAARDVAETALALLRVMAHKDRNNAVLKLLDAYDSGAFSKEDVLRFTKMTARRLRNAKNQLAAYVDRLPPEIKQGARIRA